MVGMEISSCLSPTIGSTYLPSGSRGTRNAGSFVFVGWTYPDMVGYVTGMNMRPGSRVATEQATSSICGLDWVEQVAALVGRLSSWVTWVLTRVSGHGAVVGGVL